MRLKQVRLRLRWFKVIEEIFVGENYCALHSLFLPDLDNSLNKIKKELSTI